MTAVHWIEIRKSVEGEIASLKDMLVNADSWEQTRHMQGQIAGLQWVLDEAVRMTTPKKPPTPEEDGYN